jgi:hypothetical protein
MARGSHFLSRFPRLVLGQSDDLLESFLPHHLYPLAPFLLQSAFDFRLNLAILKWEKRLEEVVRLAEDKTREAGEEVRTNGDENGTFRVVERVYY